MSSAVAGSETRAARNAKNFTAVLEELVEKWVYVACGRACCALGSAHPIASFQPIFTSRRFSGKAVTNPQIMATCIMSQYPASFG